MLGGILLLSSKKSANRLATYATPFAAGALLSAVFLDLLADGLESSDGETVLMAALVGVLLFFLAERFLRWFHHHHQHEEQYEQSLTSASSSDKKSLRKDKTAAAERRSTISLIIIGDTVHNALDGVAIAAAFLVSVPTGIVTTIAVAAHEIPQEIGDFGLLLSKGMSRMKVLLVNLAGAMATVVFALLTFTLGSEDKLPIGALIGVSAGFLLYIAMSDIIPEIHERAPKAKLLDWQPVLLIFGAAVVGVVIELAHHYLDGSA